MELITELRSISISTLISRRFRCPDTKTEVISIQAIKRSNFDRHTKNKSIPIPTLKSINFNHPHNNQINSIPTLKLSHFLLRCQVYANLGAASLHLLYCCPFALLEPGPKVLASFEIKEGTSHSSSWFRSSSTVGPLVIVVSTYQLSIVLFFQAFTGQSRSLSTTHPKTKSIDSYRKKQVIFGPHTNTKSILPSA